ncbi:MAG: hypothetical protein KJ060_13405 [Candidatus Hydrogenedentes bacterium]|nr:hypothetical protein [Candidatus Hydrogenedentota bacterium]
MTAGRKRAPWLAGVALAVLAMTGLGGAGCGRELPVEIPEIPGLTGPRMSDEEQIVEVLNDVHRGMQSRKIYKVLAHVSRSYADAEGRDYNAMQQYLNDLFKGYKEITITRVQPQVYVEGNQARAVETFGTRAEPFNANENPPIILQGQMNVYLEKIGNTWQIVEWGRML